MNVIKAQIKRFFETGKWAMKLIFLVVLVELGLIVGVVATMGEELTDEDGKHIHHLLSLAMTKSFALYSMEKAGENQKYLIENWSWCICCTQSFCIYRCNVWVVYS